MRSTWQCELEILARRKDLSALEVQDEALDVIIPLRFSGGEPLHLWHVTADRQTCHCWPAIGAESWAFDVHAIEQAITNLFLRMPNQCNLPLTLARALKTLGGIMAVLASFLQKLPFCLVLVEIHCESWP